MSSPSLLRGLLLSACLLSSVAPCGAQPQTNPQQVRAQWLQLRRTWSPLELTEPQRAIDAYEKFYNSLTDGSGDTGVEVVSRVAQLYGNELGQRERALQIYKEAMQNWRAPEQLVRLQREYDLMNGDAPDETAAVTAKIEVPETAPIGLQVATQTRGKAGTLVESLAAGRDPDELWAGGEWKSADVVWALENILTDDGLLRGRPNEGQRVREALASLLKQHGGELVSGENWRALPSKARLWLGDYYHRQNDEKTIVVLESVLQDLEARQLGKSSDKAVFFAAAERLAQDYRSKGQPQLAAQTWLRLPPFFDKSDWRLPDALLGAARAYDQAGQNEKAKALYAQIPQYGHGWFTGLAVYDRAAALISQGQHQEARQLLSATVAGEGADQAKIGLLSLQALSYYKTGELEAANRIAQQAIAQAAVTKFSSGKGLEAMVDSAEAVQAWSAQWNRAPISMLEENLRVVLAPQELDETMVTRHLLVRTMLDVPLFATVDDKRIQVRFTDNKRENDYFVQKELVLKVPHSLSQSVNATLMVSSPNFPAYQVRMLLLIEVPKPIQLSSSSVFFGEVKANEPATRKLTLSSAVPFRVVDVKSDTAALEVQSPAPQAAKEQIITLIFTSPQVGRFYNGTIRIQTDMPNGEVIEVLYAARS